MNDECLWNDHDLNTQHSRWKIKKNGNDFSVKKCHANLQLEDGDRAKTTKIDRFKVVFGKNKRKSTFF